MERMLFIEYVYLNAFVAMKKRKRKNVNYKAMFVF